MSQNLTWLETYFSDQCDGEWEHEYGVEITSTDNPGWHVRIDLTGTQFESLHVHEFNRKASESDWVVVGRTENVLFGSGGARNLAELVERMKTLLS